MCVFICFNCQDGSVDRYTMVDSTAVLAATSCIKCLVVDKAFEYIVNGLAHYRFTPLQYSIPVTPRIAGVVVHETVHTVLVVFRTDAYQLTSDT